MDLAWIAVAFALGFGATLIGLPPLVGFLGAGFVLGAFGAEGGALLNDAATFGVQLLLFGIGLKLDLRSLLRPEIWGVATLHAGITVVVFGGLLFAIGLLGLGVVAGLDFQTAALIGFALCFSSTVFAVKVLEDGGEMYALHGRVAIGILIVQDIFAVIFMTLSTGKVPSPWALTLIALIPLRGPLQWVMRRSGHGELLILFGLLVVAVAAKGFGLLGLKPDLGALVIGLVLAGTPKANELSKALLGFKDIFLVGFFLTVGLTGAPTIEGLGIAVLLVLVLPFKVVLFFRLLTLFRLRSRTALLTSTRLANYSEFGLIVGSVAIAGGWLGEEWLAIMAVALSVSFMAAAPLNVRAIALYDRFRERLRRYESPHRIPGDEVEGPGDAEIVVFGMGRIGTGAYDEIQQRMGDIVIGVDRNSGCVARHKAAGRRVALGDPTDRDFMERTRPEDIRVRVNLLTMRNHSEKLAAVRCLRAVGYTGSIAATASYTDELEELQAAGVDAAFDLLAEAGTGLADEVCDQLGAPSRASDGLRKNRQ